MVKCLHCDKRFDRVTEPFVKRKNRYIHKECYPEFKEQQSVEEMAEEAKKEESEQRVALINYVMELQGVDRPHGMVLKQIKDFHDIGYTYIGMKSTLYYFHEILENPVVGTGIGIVPHVYDDAIEWYTKKLKSQQSYDKLIGEGKELKVVKPMKVKVGPRNRSRKSKIDIGNLI